MEMTVATKTPQTKTPKTEEGKKFAENQKDELIQMGFSPDDADRIIRVAHPTHAVSAAKWTLKEVANETKAWDALMALTTGMTSPKCKTPAHRIRNALEYLGYSVPSHIDSRIGLIRFLSGVRTTLFINNLNLRKERVTQ